MKAHGLLLYLPPSLYLALIRLQADKGLGRSFAGLLALTEGLYRLGYLEEKEYIRLYERYTTPLEEVLVTHNAEEQLPPFKEALEEWATDDICVKVLGKETAEKYVELKLKEWEEYRKNVHNPNGTEVSTWELKKYLHL